MNTASDDRVLEVHQLIAEHCLSMRFSNEEMISLVSMLLGELCYSAHKSGVGGPSICKIVTSTSMAAMQSLIESHGETFVKEVH